MTKSESRIFQRHVALDKNVMFRLLVNTPINNLFAENEQGPLNFFSIVLWSTYAQFILSLTCDKF